MRYWSLIIGLAGLILTVYLGFFQNQTPHKTVTIKQSNAPSGVNIGGDNNGSIEVNNN